MKNIPLDQLEREIPHGYYCYDRNGVCPYWSDRPEHGHHNSGHCSYLEIGDWTRVPENEFRNTKTGHIGYFGLLWDKVKLCQINLKKK